MKNKSNYVKMIFIFGIVLIILLLLVIFSLIKIFIGEEDKTLSKKKMIEKKYELVDIDSINLEFKRANVVIKSSDDDNLIVTQNTKEEKYYLNDNINSHVISMEEDSYIFDGRIKKYIIKIPKSYNGKLNITNGFGEISIMNLNIELSIDNNSGGINLYKCKNIDIKDVSGDLNLDGISGYANLTSATGNITINNLDGLLNISTLTGDVIINNFKIEGDSSIENISGNIGITINRDSVCKIKYSNESGQSNINKNICLDKKNILNIKNVTGNININ